MPFGHPQWGGTLKTRAGNHAGHPAGSRARPRRQERRRRAHRAWWPGPREPRLGAHWPRRSC